MTKARDLADFIATGTLADGSLEVADVDGLQTALDGKETADATILKEVDIGSTVQPYDATILTSSDIGTSIQGYDATTLKSADIGSSVQGYDATILKQADIGTSVLAPDGDASQLTGIDAGGMTLLSSTVIGTDSNYTITLPTNWWNGTYRYLKLVYSATFQSGDPPTGTYTCLFRIAGNGDNIYTYQGTYGTTSTAGTSTSGRLTIGSGQDNAQHFIHADIFCDGTSTFVTSNVASAWASVSGIVQTRVNNVTATSFDIYQPAYGSERYRFEGTVYMYGVK